MSRKTFRVSDTLYGAVMFDERLTSLIMRPVVQRLRHVRLSNVDSVAMPGIAHLSRFEHVLGVSQLVRHLSFASTLTPDDRTTLEAAAVLHDWAISPYGHIVEEAFAYAGLRFDHEDKLLELVEHENAEEAGGISRQLFLGRETGLEQWAQETFGPRSAGLRLREITDWIRGRGRFGKLISSEMDLDNLDNVTRIAFHMGLPTDRALPVRIASSIIHMSEETGMPVFRKGASEHIVAWLDLRASVYNNLMRAEPDFAMKIMVLYAAVFAIKHDDIRIRDWNLTDREFVNLLLTSKSLECRETTVRWLAGEYWETSALCWVEGERPSYPELLSFSEEISEALGRACFAYGIKDKRQRQLSILVAEDDPISLGTKSAKWLAGVGSPVRRAFTVREQQLITSHIERRFNSEVKHDPNDIDSEQMCLL